MSEEGELDKSEQASPHKLKKAREKGQVARGMDVGMFAALAVVLIWAWIMGPALGQSLAQGMQRAFLIGPELAVGVGPVMEASYVLFADIMRPILILVAGVFAVVLLLELLQTGIVASAQPLKPDFTRLNPAKGLKRLFSWRMLIETAKNIVKMALYTVIGWLILRYSWREELAGITDARSLATVMAAASIRLVAAFALIALFFAAIDQLIVRRDFAKRMRMSRRELKREARDREGEPRQKQKRKQMHGEFIKISQSLRGLSSADILVTNPTHYAVALRYRVEEIDAPVAVSMGSHRFAERLKKLALLYNVPVIENPVLAKALYKACRLNDPVPESLFEPVADIYNRMRQRQDATSSEITSNA